MMMMMMMMMMMIIIIEINLHFSALFLVNVYNLVVTSIVTVI